MRRRWTRQLVLAVVLGCTAAAVLTVLAGSRRTASAYDRMTRGHGYPTVELQDMAMKPGELRTLVERAGNAAVGGYRPMFAAPDRPDVLPGRDFIVFGATDDSYGRAIDRPVLAAGRLPDPRRADEVFVSVDTARALQLRVGSEFPMRSIPASQMQYLESGREDRITLTGPRTSVRVVGIGRTRLDYNATSYAREYAFATPAWLQRFGGDTAGWPELLDVRLRGGTRATDAFLARFPASVAHDQQFTVSRFKTSSIGETTRVQAFALLLVGLAAAMAWIVFALALVGRTTARLDDERRTLGVLGLTRAGRGLLAAVELAPATVGAVVIAVIGAAAASSLFPDGPAATIETAPGLHFDATVIVTGAACIALIVALRAALAGGSRVTQPVPVVPRSRGMRERAVALPASVATGVRWSLPARGAHARSGRAALTGSVLVIAAVLAGVTYGAAIQRLVSTPKTYGWAYDADAGGGSDNTGVDQLREKVLHDRAVADVAVGHVFGGARIAGHDIQAYAFTPLRGALRYSIVAGRAPVANDEVALGPDTLHSLRTRIGGDVQTPTPNGASVRLHVVGTALFPSTESDAYAEGALLTPAMWQRLRAVVDGQLQGYDELYFRFRPGVDRTAEIARMRAADMLNDVAHPPAAVRDLRLVRAYPLWLAAFIALLGFLAVCAALVTTPRRRRREIGVLRAIGLTRAQLARASAVQGCTVALVGVAIGLPLGVLIGRASWTLHADRISVAVHVGVPAGTAIIVTAAAVVAFAVLATALARHARTLRPAEALRAE